MIITSTITRQVCVLLFVFILQKSSPSGFAPLRVDYMERFSAAGMTAGGYNKRDGR